MYIVSKEFNFEYGHRIHNQFLEVGECKCRNLHGHSGVIVVRLSSEELIRGMVWDFTNLSFFKEFVDKYLDHKMLMDYNDPMMESLMGKGWKSGYKVMEFCGSKLYIFDEVSVNFSEVYEYEKYKSFVFLECEPTSENLSKFLADVLLSYLPESIKVEEVVFKESVKTQAVYRL